MIIHSYLYDTICGAVEYSQPPIQDHKHEMELNKYWLAFEWTHSNEI